MGTNVLFYLGIILVTGLLCGRLAKLVKLPNVTGYLVGGLIIGPSVLGLVPADTVESLGILSDIALGFIAVSIGSEFKASYFKRVGFTPVVIAILEGVLAIVAVVLGLLAAGQELPFALVLGAIASATAPAATIMVIRQYRAKGPVTETLLSVVALDDAVALIGFGFAVALAGSLVDPTASLAASIFQPVLELLYSLALGGALGALMTLPMRFFKKDSNRLCILVAFVFLATAIAAWINASALLTCMAMGAALINLHRDGGEMMRIGDSVTPPILMMFFVLSGAGLNLGILPTIGLVGVIYMVLRVVGKMAGAWLGAVIMKAPAVVRRYLGPALIPQAGVAIGLSLVAQSVVPEHAAAIRAVVLCATLIYELVGPAVSKFTLMKAGEIREENAVSRKKKAKAA